MAVKITYARAHNRVAGCVRSRHAARHLTSVNVNGAWPDVVKVHAMV